MFKNVLIDNPTLAGTAVTTPSVSAFRYLSWGILRSKGSGACPAITGNNIASGNARVFALYINDAGTFTWDASDEFVNTAPINLNTVVSNKRNLRGSEGILVGYMIISCAAAFTAGTTNLNAANITTTYVNAYGLTQQDDSI